MKKKKGKEASNRERKEVGKMAVAGTVSQERRRGLKALFEKKKDVKVQQHIIPTAKDELLHDGLSDFERQIIMELREDGVSDDVIRQWMREI